VARRFVSAAEYVHPGSRLFSLVSEDPLKLRGDVPQRFAHAPQIGQPVQVRVNALAPASRAARPGRERLLALVGGGSTEA